MRAELDKGRLLLGESLSLTPEVIVQDGIELIEVRAGEALGLLESGFLPAFVATATRADFLRGLSDALLSDLGARLGVARPSVAVTPPDVTAALGMLAARAAHLERGAP
ncbi:MAG: hypothetical protein JXR96_04910 [Deltaproteobacteria bacterium]|nr:hypothetical protein [Deltaproteobacteria bacterium]